jgi:hypothetical protein
MTCATQMHTHACNCFFFFITIIGLRFYVSVDFEQPLLEGPVPGGSGGSAPGPPPPVPARKRLQVKVMSFGMVTAGTGLTQAGWQPGKPVMQFSSRVVV